jgi:hypothetical protein
MKGWRKPSGAVVVARPTVWGNPFTITDCITSGAATDRVNAARLCVDAFAQWLAGQDPWADTVPDRRIQVLTRLPELVGHVLACWCPLGAPCHADVLLTLAAAHDGGSDLEGAVLS